jgi:crossover junction endodeoxyribonuclease RuvC
LYTDQIILGIDPGTRITGYGVILLTEGKIEVIDFGCIRPPVQEETSKRYLSLFNGMEQLLIKYSPHAVAVETQFVYKNVQSALKLGMARAAVLIASSRKDIPVFEYSPTRAKKAVTGQGSASKEQVQRMVQLLLKLASPPTPEDASDALALAICHAHTRNVHVRSH